ncbi:MAG: hypothetical protein GWN39_19650, partial [Thermoplasmata archaeon]|nr:hypothetical protein [Thermoplasmata archaeon]NIT75426.1 hypothetical protein [Thermoplasmata archaeon]NIV80901.1 hypothetical protein [Thermoplasmata archaeon]NIW87284.1 hypothetical protein [Thermoplasmata archaeon]NIY01797.1 hypothetical protein [Thermoplasmata archaeon]
FHSRPERNLDENFFEETSDNPTLRALVAARSGGHLNAVYMGRPSRLRVEPISDTPLSVVVIYDDQYPGTVHFQTLSFALSMFGAWVIVLWVVVLAVEFTTPGRLQWVWPDVRYPEKYVLLNRMLGGFALLLLLQALLAIDRPVHPSTLLVPVQALALGLVVVAKGVKHVPRVRVPAWRKASVLGWGLLVAATVLQLAIHVLAGWSILLWIPQLGLVSWAGYRAHVLTLKKEEEPHSREDVRPAYVTSAALTLAVMGLLPALVFYQEAFAEHLERLVRHQQVVIVEGLHDRAARVRADHRDSGLPEAFDPLVIEDEITGLAFQPEFARTGDTPVSWTDSVTELCRWE